METNYIHHLFEHIAKKYPHNRAIEDESRKITYQDLNFRANKMASIFANLAFRGNCIVGLYMEASLDYVLTILGILKSGSVFLPLNPNLPDRRIGSTLEETKPAAIITNPLFEKELISRLNKYDRCITPDHILIVDDDYNIKINAFKNDKPDARLHRSISSTQTPVRQSDDWCYIMTTSGSTGKPKAILGSHKGLTHFINWEINEFGLHSSCKVSLLSPVTFDVSLRDIFIPLCTGGTLCIPDEKMTGNPLSLFQWLHASGVTLMHIVPTLFRLLAEAIPAGYHKKNILPALKHILIAGETLYGNDIIKWRKIIDNHIELINVYGPSETTLAKLYYRINDKRFKPADIVPLGKPLPDSEVMIIQDYKRCAHNVVGEIHIKTRYMSHGYYNNSDLTNQSFIQNPLVTDHKETVYKTGDLGRISKDGNVQFMGRYDDQIKLFGKRIETGEIEVALSKHPNIRQVAVTTRDDEYNNKRLIAYLLSKSGEKPGVEQLRNFLRKQLPDYMIPAVFLFLDVLPLTQNGKIDRKALPELNKTRPKLADTYVAPITRLERIISQIWCQVLHLDRVGIDDNFFDLGGNSMLSAQIITILQKEFHREIPFIKMFQYPNIRSIAKYLSQERNHNLFHSDIQKRADLRKMFLASQKQLNAKG